MIRLRGVSKANSYRLLERDRWASRDGMVRLRVCGRWTPLVCTGDAPAWVRRWFVRSAVGSRWQRLRAAWGAK